MTPLSIAELNEAFSIQQHLRFTQGPGGLTIAEIANTQATATVALLGAHVLSFQPRGQAPVLWMSKSSWFEVGQPIRGGIPVCWPWFGAHPADSALPNHGFARRMLWHVLGTDVRTGGVTAVRLGLESSAETLPLWGHDFRLEMELTVGREMTVSLLMRNIGGQPFTITAALHSYFHVSDIAHVTVRGLENSPYIDTVGTRTRKVQQGPIAFVGETDRVYLDTATDCLIDDPGLNRRIRVAKRGSRSTVVWNPWMAKSARMPDFGDEEWTGMLCVETTNAAEDAVTLAPHEQHTLAAILSIDSSRL